jgi:hypothetical protein
MISNLEMQEEEEPEISIEDARIARIKQISDAIDPDDLSRPPLWNSFEVLSVILSISVLCFVIREFLYY